ncbi:MAG: endolytic transglycosylase MltG, partial [Saprospiraceae bacterium]|nr:endolytic transglycosylase MltG [Saprospiraceae bacterium]
TATITEILTAFTLQFDQQVSEELRQGFQRQGLDLYQAVTLASIVQREAMVADEQPMIASVFYNRLRKPMKLDSDPTVQYAVGYNTPQKTWWTNPLSSKDLKVDSPYNTYTRIGLPPGPIASPGLSALRAVAYPAQSPYFYFQAKCDKSGMHAFAVTYAEHLNNICP